MSVESLEKSLLGLDVRLWPGNIRIPDVAVARRGGRRVNTPAADGVLRLERPWPVELDLRAAARG